MVFRVSTITFPYYPNKCEHEDEGRVSAEEERVEGGCVLQGMMKG